VGTVVNETSRIVIVGAGHAGGTAAALLRQWGHKGPITLVGEEPTAPYQRPPLSKAYLKDEAGVEDLKLKPDDFYAEQGVTLRLGARAEEIDRQSRLVRLKGGGELAYDQLILATGSVNRKLAFPSARPHDLHELRNIADAERLKAALGPGRRLVIIGGGYIGLEAAASARALGAQATVIELAPRVLARVACEELSAFFEAYHRARGVEILTGAEVSDLVHGQGGRLEGVRLTDGRDIACDAVLVGVGAAPASELAMACGLECQGGIVVDETALTSDPFIYAIGDVTVRPMPLYGGRRHRLESVPGALEQARQAAAAILGRPAPAPEAPWFWSDQYDVKLQIAGLPFDADARVIRGSVESGKFALFHLKGERLLAVEAVNSPAEFMAGRQLIAQGRAVDRAKLADPGVSMKAVAG
jgi:3-phenylpropionate/trans-cinnamate dioxygenase ferredoxin reductase subunit